MKQSNDKKTQTLLTQLQHIVGALFTDWRTTD